MCDKKYELKVEANEFKNMINKYGIKLDGGAQNRLIQICDEDCNGEITKKELYFALHLYKCNTENVVEPNKISP